jgi:serine/threonine-protein kinase
MDSTAPWNATWTTHGKPIGGGQSGVTKVVRGNQIGALKLLHARNTKDSSRRARVAKEVAALRRLVGTGIAAIYDENISALQDREVELYIVQEWIEGHSLEEFLNHPVKIDEALQITRQLATVLHRCHAEDVMHRDIKPSNVMLRPDGQVVLIDFGIAQIDVEEIVVHTELCEELGNRFLRLPEMTAGQERRDQRSDMACVVGILFFLLTGVYPRSPSLGANGLPPHEFYASRFPVHTTMDDRFAGHLRWLFNVGFQVVPNFRIQTAEQLIGMIDDMNKPKESDPMSLAMEKLKRFDAAIQSEEVSRRQQLMSYLRSVGLDIEQQLRSLCEERRLTFIPTSSNREQHAGVEAPFRIKSQAPAINQSGNYRIAVDPDDQSIVVGTLTLAGASAQFYRGPLVNIELLRQLAKEQAFRSFAELGQRHLDKAQLIKDVFDY